MNTLTDFFYMLILAVLVIAGVDTVLQQENAHHREQMSAIARCQQGVTR